MFDAILCMNSAKSSETNCGPLSDTSSSGKPCWANLRRNSFMVFSVVIQVMCCTSIHLE